MSVYSFFFSNLAKCLPLHRRILNSMLMVRIMFLFVCLYYKLEFLPTGVRKSACGSWLQSLLLTDHEQFNLSLGMQNKSTNLILVS